MRVRWISSVLALAGLVAPPSVAFAAPSFVLQDRAEQAGLDGISLVGTAWYGVAIAFVDLDGDGWPDLYFGAGRGQRDWLCLNRRDGRFACSNVGSVNASDVLAISAGDYDNDGDLDLYLMRVGKNALLRNDGHARFEDVTDATAASGDPARITATGTFLDYDGDGRLDLYLGHWFGSSDDFLARDQLLHQTAHGIFEDLTAPAQIDDGGRSTLALIAYDYDGDGRQDLYLTGDGGEDSLFHNRGDGTFEDVTARQPSGFAALAREGMGIDVADYDGDGRFDLYVSNAKRPGGPDGSVLLVQRADGYYDSRAAELGVQADFGWGTAWVDLDNDGWPDIAVFGDVADHHFLYHNVEGKRFDAQLLPGTNFGTMSCVAAAFADYDGDGRVDVVLARFDGTRPMLLHNETPTANHWVGVTLRGEPRQRDPLGSLVEVRIGARWLKRQLLAQTSRGAQNERRLHFGLGGAAQIDELVVTWPSGARERATNLPVDRTLTIQQGVGVVRPAEGGCAMAPLRRGDRGPFAALGVALGVALGRARPRRRRRGPRALLCA
jgi:hypothetical protein